MAQRKTAQLVSSVPLSLTMTPVFRVRSPVPSQNLKPDVLMMGPAEDRYRGDATDLLGPAKIRSIFIQ